MFDFSNASRFHQAEDPKIRINDTLERYPVETTFREYLANADDAKASEVNWLLDDTQYQGRNLIAPSMKQFQGPALLVHNNSGNTNYNVIVSFNE
jgi:sacsin